MAAGRATACTVCCRRTLAAADSRQDLLQAVVGAGFMNLEDRPNAALAGAAFQGDFALVQYLLWQNALYHPAFESLLHLAVWAGYRAPACLSTLRRCRVAARPQGAAMSCTVRRRCTAI